MIILKYEGENLRITIVNYKHIVQEILILFFIIIINIFIKINKIKFVGRFVVVVVVVLVIILLYYIYFNINIYTYLFIIIIIIRSSSFINYL